MIISAAIIFVQSQIYKPISLVSELLKIDRQILLCVCYLESGFDTNAVSPRGAIGLMQVMPKNLESLNASKKSFNHNIIAGAIFLKRYLRIFDNNLALALAAYNAGPNTVKRYKGIPPYPETKNYLIRFLHHYSNTKFCEKKEN